MNTKKVKEAFLGTVNFTGAIIVLLLLLGAIYNSYGETKISIFFITNLTIPIMIVTFIILLFKK